MSGPSSPLSAGPDHPENSSEELKNNIQKASTPNVNSDDRVLNRWRRSFGLLTGLGLTAEERADAFADQQRQVCERWKAELVKYSQYPLLVL